MFYLRCCVQVIPIIFGFSCMLYAWFPKLVHAFSDKVKLLIFDKTVFHYLFKELDHYCRINGGSKINIKRFMVISCFVAFIHHLCFVSCNLSGRRYKSVIFPEGTGVLWGPALLNLMSFLFINCYLIIKWCNQRLTAIYTAGTNLSTSFDSMLAANDSNKRISFSLLLLTEQHTVKDQISRQESEKG